MSIESIVKVEFPALSRTIRDYTTEFYISSYADKFVLKSILWMKKFFDIIEKTYQLA